MNLQMNTARVYLTECFQNKTTWTQTKSEMKRMPTDAI